jgi:DNA-binding transcriptional ArsR family regulator
MEPRDVDQPDTEVPARADRADDPPQAKRLDSESLKALAHPLRMRLLGLLRRYGADTATGLGRRVGESSGTTSYHLRRLARHGFVEEDAGRGNGRDRWWRAVHRSTVWDATQFDADPGAAEALDVFGHVRLESQSTLVRTWLETRREWPAAWREAAGEDDYVVHLDAEQLAALAADLRATVERYVATPPAPAAERVSVVLYAIPERTPEGEG